MNKTSFLLIASSIASLLASGANAETKTAVFAGGCFWCMEKDFEHVNGVIKAVSGYTGGTSENPTYKNYVQGGHVEAIRVYYDSEKVTYSQLLHTFWRSVNPTDAGGQFCDRGHAYTTAIFALNEEQNSLANQSKKALIDANILGKPIVTPIVAASKFWPAETYHQDYYKKNAIRYTFYRTSCGRDRTIKKLWGKQAHDGINY